MTSAAWLEEWEATCGPFDATLGRKQPDTTIRHVFAHVPREVEGPTAYESRARLAAAAPDLVRALLRAEWNGARHDLVEKVCPDCGAYAGWATDSHKHHARCDLDAALRKAGFPTARGRADARRELRLRDELAETEKRRGG